MRLFIIALLFLLLATPAAAEETLGEDVQEFFKKLQQLIRDNKREEIAKRVFYPLSVDGTSAILNQKDFIRSYDSIFNKEVKDCVLGHDTRGELSMSHDSFKANWGCVWADIFDDGKIYLYAVNTRQ